jgi:hypothetical protein
MDPFMALLAEHQGPSSHGEVFNVAHSVAQLAAFPLHGASQRCKFHCIFHVIQVLLPQPTDTSHVKGLFSTSKYSHC